MKKKTIFSYKRHILYIVNEKVIEVLAKYAALESSERKFLHLKLTAIKSYINAAI